MKTEELKLFYEPKERLRLTVGEERSYLTVKPVWAAPLSHPNAYLALMNGKGEEITVRAGSAGTARRTRGRQSNGSCDSAT